MIPVEWSETAAFSLFGLELRLYGSYWLPDSRKQAVFDRFDGAKSLGYGRKSATTDLCKSAFVPN